jgi:hypothetical protein
MRKRTEAEVRDALERIKNKRAFKKLSDVETHVPEKKLISQ